MVAGEVITLPSRARLQPAAQSGAGLVALIGAAFVLVLSQYFGSGLAERPLGFRFYWSALPTAVSAMRGISDDWTYPVELSDYFQTAGPLLTNEQLRASLTLPIHRPEDRTMGLKMDDPGLPLFIRTSFAIFGVSLRAPHYCFFLVFGASLLLFAIGHFRDPPALRLLLFVVLSVYAFTFVLGLSTQLATAADARFISTLAIVPCLHVALVIGSRRWSWPAQALCVAPAVLLAAVHQVRGSSGWTVAALLIVCLWAICAARRRTFSSVAASIVPLAVTCALMLAAADFQQRRINEQLRAEVLPRHVFWHAVLVGFAVNPVLAERFQLSFEDLPAYKAVVRHLVRTGDTARLQAVFGGDGSAIAVDRFNWREYDRAARDTVLHIAREAPLAAVAAFAYYKPRMFIASLAWATGMFPARLPKIAVRSQWISSEPRRIAGDEYLRWFRPVAALLFLLGIAHTAWSEASVARDQARVGHSFTALAMLGTSAIPGLVALPAFHWVADALVMTGVGVYMAVAVPVAYVFRHPLVASLRGETVS